MQDYLGWKYGYNQATDKFLLEPKGKYTVPRTFFKYYALNKNSVDALTNMYVYASHPNQLNDPFDCDENLARIDDEDNARALWGELYDKAKCLFNDESSFYEYSTKGFSTVAFSKWGVLSLTDSCENTIMWPRYANNNGFCLEWDIKQFPFKWNGPFPIHYVKKKKIASSLKYNVPTLALIQSNVKLVCWKYENEWRLMIQPPVGFDMMTFGEIADQINVRPGMHDRKFKYPISALKSMTLGINFFKDLQDRQQILPFPSYELHACYQEECLQTTVLDFLNVIKDYVTIRLMVKEGLKSNIINVAVTKVNHLTYRISRTK
ncbi:MAG: DUF2971 domain-containing protein [Salinivirgaceae bacterium]|nr:DUF2971 domain-containing protein [Salinivirgaceae bacterium]